MKCALRFFLREEETLAFSFMAANWTLGYQGLQGLTTSPMIANQAKTHREGFAIKHTTSSTGGFSVSCSGTRIGIPASSFGKHSCILNVPNSFHQKLSDVHAEF